MESEFTVLHAICPLLLLGIVYIRMSVADAFLSSKERQLARIQNLEKEEKKVDSELAKLTSTQ